MHFLKLLFIPCKENEYRPRILGRAGITALLALMLAVEGFLVASVIVRNAGSTFLAAVEQGALIALTNSDRTTYSLRPLGTHPLLNAAAEAKARDMAARGYFSHAGPSGEEPWSWLQRAGYAYEYAGENLAVHFSDSSDVERAWMASPTHRANILKPQYTEIGIGVAQGYFNGEPATYVVQYFASPAGNRLASAVASAASPAEESEASPTSEEPVVAGAAVPGGTAPAAVSAYSQENVLARTFLKLAGSPRETALYILGIMTALLALAVGLTFFIHIRIQPGELLLGGISVAGLAALFFTLNASLLSGRTSIEGQAASIVWSAETVPESAVVLTSVSTTTVPTLIE